MPYACAPRDVILGVKVARQGEVRAYVEAPIGALVQLCRVPVFARVVLYRLDTFNLSTKCPQTSVQEKEAAEATSFARNSGGRQEARTPDLRVANAALSQLS